MLAKLGELRIAPLLGALRGQPPRDVGAVARMAVKLGEALVAWDGKVAPVDINPVIPARLRSMRSSKVAWRTDGQNAGAIIFRP